MAGSHISEIFIVLTLIFLLDFLEPHKEVLLADKKYLVVDIFRGYSGKRFLNNGIELVLAKEIHMFSKDFID